MMTKRALELLERLPGLAVLCLGDFVVDRYVHGSASRISPEAPVPVVHVSRKTDEPGGVGGLARNLTPLGVAAKTICVSGSDADETAITRLYSRRDWPAPVFVREPGRATPVNTRVVAGIQQVVRFDDGPENPLTAGSVSLLAKNAAGLLSGVGAIVLSDAGGGCVTAESAAEILRLAAAKGVPVLVDPSDSDYGRYAGCALACPNRKELTTAAGRFRLDDDEIEPVGRSLMAKHGIGNLLVTLGRKGMLYLPGKGKAVAFPARAREVFDVAGAGDAVAALLAACLAAGEELETGIVLASLAASVVVGKAGTASASPEEIRRAAED